MLNTVKNVMHTIGEGTGDLARRVSCATGDAAKSVGRGTADVARRVGDSSIDLARKIGPKRGLIGLAVIGVATVGTVYLVRYLRARREELPLEGEELETSEQDGVAAKGPKHRKGGKRSTAHAMH